MKNKRLSKNFMLNHFKVSSLYPEIAKRLQFTKEDELKFLLLCHLILEPLYEYLKGRYKKQKVLIKILSGKRNYRLNQLEKELIDNTSHVHSLACDFTILVNYQLKDEILKEAFDFIKNQLKYNFSELFLYTPMKQIHVALRTKEEQRIEIL